MWRHEKPRKYPFNNLHGREQEAVKAIAVQEAESLPQSYYVPKIETRPLLRLEMTQQQDNETPSFPSIFSPRLYTSEQNPTGSHRTITQSKRKRGPTRPRSEKSGPKRRPRAKPKTEGEGLHEVNSAFPLIEKDNTVEVRRTLPAPPAQPSEKTALSSTRSRAKKDVHGLSTVVRLLGPSSVGSNKVSSTSRVERTACSRLPSSQFDGNADHFKSKTNSDAEPRSDVKKKHMPTQNSRSTRSSKLRRDAGLKTEARTRRPKTSR